MSKLVIYIPTYNRPLALNKQLSVLSQQLVDGDESVIIIVRDNNSDNYDLDDLKIKYKSNAIIFKKNFSNIDGNANISLGFMEVQKEDFLWILSDNDIVSLNCLNVIKPLLEVDFDFLIFSKDFHEKSYEILDSDFESRIKNLWYHGLISFTIYRMNRFTNEIKNAFFYHNSSFPHLAIILSFVNSKSNIAYLKLPLNIIHDFEYSNSENKGDYSLSKVGMPLLAPLMPPKFKKYFCNGWAKERLLYFHLSKHVYPEISYATKKILYKNGSYPLVFFYYYKSLVFSLVIKLFKFINFYRFLEINQKRISGYKFLSDFILKVRKTEFW